ncbi:MAG TPA: glycosyltransferase [Hyphomicrobium sp.]|nr:glycosyltransferase [Hyphomicrobium sp.]
MARINLIVWDNGAGLSRDLRLLQDALLAGGHSVQVVALRRRGKQRKLSQWALSTRIACKRLRGGDAWRDDINIFLERPRPEYFSLGRRNLLIPNPEWIDPKSQAILPTIDRLLVKTRYAETIFAARDCAANFIGFTSSDRLDTTVTRERTFFHLAGRSTQKNTEPLLALWRRHPEWPRLTVVQNPETSQPGAPQPNIAHRIDYLDDAELKRLQNAHRFHLCPSETEGFGHYLVEAMSVGAVVLTLDAAPMNELITPDRGLLVPVSRTDTQNLATINFFNEAAMEAAIGRVLALDDDEVERLGAAARGWFEANDAGFIARVNAAIRDVI